MKWINKWSLYATIACLLGGSILVGLALAYMHQAMIILKHYPDPILDPEQYWHGIKLAQRAESYFYLGVGLGALAQPEAHALIYLAAKHQEIPKRTVLFGGLFLFFALLFIFRGL